LKGFIDNLYANQSEMYKKKLKTGYCQSILSNEIFTETTQKMLERIMCNILHHNVFT
jgi:hypothetical protein